MNFPLSFLDISLWLAVTAIILLFTAEVIVTYYEKKRLPFDQKRLTNVAVAMAILFLITIGIRIYEILAQP
jgi:hypothetical protein